MSDEIAPLHLHRSEVALERGSGTVRLLRSAIRNRGLVWELARREMTDVHAGQMAGVIWLVLHPLVLFLVYATLFTVVFKVRIGDRGPSDYLVYLLSGLAPWLLSQDAIVRSANAMIANSVVVKKVMLPLEALVAKTTLASVSVQSILLALTLIYAFVERESLPPVLLLLPALLVIHAALLWGLSLLLSAFQPYFRDLGELIRIFMTVNVYLMPVMYTPAMVPHHLRLILALNPFSHLIWCYQDVIYFNAVQHPWSWVVTTCFAALSIYLGSFVFTRLRHHLSSVV